VRSTTTGSDGSAEAARAATFALVQKDSKTWLHALELRHRIEQLGGLVTVSQLAEHWEVSPQRVRQLASHRDFPPPVATVQGARVWPLREVDEWRSVDRYREHRKRTAQRVRDLPLADRLVGEYTLANID
jgi:predicted DNA-binding transcriptional regulator AlpA